MARKARFKVVGRFDSASRFQPGTVTIDRDAGLFTVRPCRRRREYVLPLDTVADMMVQRIIKAEVLAKRLERKKKKA